MRLDIRALTKVPFDSGLFRGLNRLMVELRAKTLIGAFEALRRAV